jgi:pimeloyl-ACP methyl ester carboxylesterase
MKYATAEFARYRGEGQTTVEYQTAEGMGARETLAYLDRYRDGTAAAVVMDPATGRSHTYGRRPEHSARRIIDRHLARLGYTELAEATIGGELPDVVTMQIIKNGEHRNGHPPLLGG